MTDNRDAGPAPVPAPPQGATGASIVSYDQADAFEHANGVISITLTGNRAWTTTDGMREIRVVTALLKGNVQAFFSLRKMIDEALAVAAAGKAEPPRA